MERSLWVCVQRNTPWSWPRGGRTCTWRTYSTEVDKGGSGVGGRHRGTLQNERRLKISVVGGTMVGSQSQRGFQTQCRGWKETMRWLCRAVTGKNHHFWETAEETKPQTQRKDGSNGAQAQCRQRGRYTWQEVLGRRWLSGNYGAAHKPGVGTETLLLCPQDDRGALWGYSCP